MTEKRFEMNVGVLNFTDNQTKRMYSEYNLEEIVELLNAQHDALIKKDELLSKTLKVNSNYEKCLKEIDDVLSKHNIHTLEKLDQVLTNERTW